MPNWVSTPHTRRSANTRGMGKGGKGEWEKGKGAPVTTSLFGEGEGGDTSFQPLGYLIITDAVEL